MIDNADTAAQSLFGAGNQHLNYLRKRGLDGLFLKTKDHWMELFFPVDLGVAGLCKIVVFELDGGPKTKKVHELMNEYPVVDAQGGITLASTADHVGTAFHFGPYGPDGHKAMQARSDKLKLEL